MNKNNLS